MDSSIRLDNGQITIEIAALGAEMQAITSADGADWLWEGDPEFWSGRAPVLFPIVGKAPQDQLGIEGKNYPMQQHGFARRHLFKLVESGAEFAIFELKSSAETLDVYPFEFSLRLNYRLVACGVSVIAEVSNLDKRPMPMQLGFHPAFVWPLPGGADKVHEIRLADDAAPALQRLQNGLLSAHRQPSPFRAGRLRLERSQFTQDAMIFSEGAGSSLTYGVSGGARIEFSWTGLPNLALWSKARAPFLCIEPWHGTVARAGADNSMMHRPYVLVLKPGTAKQFGYQAKFVR